MMNDPTTDAALDATPEPRILIPETAPDPMPPPMPAGDTLAEKFQKLGNLRRREADLRRQHELAEREVVGLAEAARAALLANDAGRLSDDELAETRRALHDAKFRAQDLVELADAMKAEIPEAEAAAYAAAPGARTELWERSIAELERLAGRYRDAVTEAAQIVAEAQAVAIAADHPAYQGLCRIHLSGALLDQSAQPAKAPQPPADPLTDALWASLRLVQRAERDKAQAERDADRERSAAEARRRLAPA